MAKSTKGEEQTVEKTEGEEQTVEKAESETITVSAAEFSQMKEQIALLSKFMAGDAKMKTAAEKKAEEYESLLEVSRKANERSMELVKVHIDRGNRWGNQNAEVSINGKQYVIPKGCDVEIPRCVAEVLSNADRQKDIAYDMQEEKAAEFEKAEASRAFSDGIAVGG